MLNWRTILCGVDGSDESLRAVKLGAMIAQRLPGRLLCLYVIPSHQVFQLGIHRAEGRAELAADADSLLNKIQSETGFPIERMLQEGDPAYAILETAAEHACDLVVLGHRGLGKVERWLLGSVATKVISHTPCAVLVSKGADLAPENPFARTLYGLDGSPESARAAMEAMGLVKLLGGAIRFAHVTHCEKGTEIKPSLGDYESADALLSEFCERARQAGVVADSVELKGHTAGALLDHAEVWNATLMALGSRGLGGFAGLRLGSTSYPVAQHSKCSVLVSPSRQA
jgi:nucleotide-binding universal stress UspA family protein